jgi:hypothetical protein
MNPDVRYVEQILKLLRIFYVFILLMRFPCLGLINRVNKANRGMGVLENKEEGERYAEHGLRKFLRTRPPEIMPTVNHFFSEDK